ncbi:MAG: hypothetical protein IT381_09720 [Deltaproteobacteria bacterium]|nr:hypothetical protein [Deltaproteobacteria bacterium]
MEIRSTPKNIPAAADASRPKEDGAEVSKNENSATGGKEAKVAAEKREDAKVAGDGKATIAATEQPKVTDVVVKSEAGALVASLLQAVGKQGELPVSAGSSAAGLEAFTQLKELLGAPKANVPDGLRLRDTAGEGYDVVLSPETMSFFASVTTTSDGGVSVDGGAMRAILEQSGITLEAQSWTGNATTEKGKAAELRATLQKYGALVEKFFTKHTELSPQALLEKQPTAVVVALQKAMPQILDTLRATFKEIDGQLKGKSNDAEIVIPSRLVVEAEARFQPVLEAAGANEKALAALKSDPQKFATFQTALRQRRETGKLDGVPADIAKVVRDVAPFSEEKGSMRTVTDAAARSESIADQSFDDVIAGGDIEALIYWIMNQVADDATSELRDIMKEMKKSLDAKKVQREKIQKMKSEQARIDIETRKEFNDLAGAGLLAKETTYEDYKAWRPVQRSEDGSAQLKPIETKDIPVLLREGRPAVADATGETTPVSFKGLKPDYAKLLAEKYGVSPGDIQALYALWDHNPAYGVGPKQIAVVTGHTLADFQDFLTGKPGYGAKLKEGDKAGNQKRLEEILKDVAATGQKTDAMILVAKIVLPDTPAADPNTIMVDGVPVSRHPRASDLDAMDDAKLKGLYEALRAEIKGNTLPSFDEFKAMMCEYIKAVCHGGGQRLNDACEAIETAFGKAGGVLLQGVMAEMRERVLQTFVKAVNDKDLKTLRETLGLSVQEIPPFGGVGSSGIPGSGGLGGLGDDTSGFGSPGSFYCIEGWTTIGYDAQFNEDWAQRGKGSPSAWTPKMNLGPEAKTLKANLDSDYTSFVQGKDGGKSGSEPPPPPPPPKKSFETQFATQWSAQRDQDKQDQAVAAHNKAEAEKRKKEKTDATEGALGSSAGGAIVVNEDGTSADGRRWQTGTAASFAADIDKAKDDLDSMGEQSELMQTRLQLYMDRRAKAMETLSNVMKKMAQTSEVIIGNMK